MVMGVAVPCPLTESAPIRIAEKKMTKTNSQCLNIRFVGCILKCPLDDNAILTLYRLRNAARGAAV
jgi:hypothetical protein